MFVAFLAPVSFRGKLTHTQAVIPKVQKPPEFGVVTYEIHLHPTYQAPCLWFRLDRLPVDEPAFNIDTVFRRLVPDQYKDSLRKVGNVGGISADVSACFFAANSSIIRSPDVEAPACPGLILT